MAALHVCPPPASPALPDPVSATVDGDPESLLPFTSALDEPPQALARSDTRRSMQLEMERVGCIDGDYGRLGPNIPFVR